MRLVALSGLIATLVASASAQRVGPSGPSFDVVSIRQKTIGAGAPSIVERPDGSVVMTNVTVATLIAKAYPPFVPLDLVGLPGWARSNQYDVSATSSVPQATMADRAQMLRAVLVERFNLAAHIEKRDKRVYALMRLRADGPLGKRLASGTEEDCVAFTARKRAAGDGARAAETSPSSRGDSDANLQPCSVRTIGSTMEGDVPIAALASLLRQFVREVVVDRTGLTGNYRFSLEFDQSNGTAQRSVELPSIFTALQEQLGLKLEPLVEVQDVLVVDRVERPSEN
jgi:uncharacterized protein (TIGR03435 family)